MKQILKKKVEAHGEEVSELEIREPEFGDLMAMDAVKGEVAKLGKLIEVLCGINAQAVRHLHPDDAAEIAEKVSPFFARFRAIGARLEDN